ncbi:MAG: flavin reductase family protein [Alphaproteobacteria bacterium]
MYYEPARNDHGLARDPFKSLVVPRPIGWISTLGRDGVLNLAPYSFFNAVATGPAIVMFCPGGRRPSHGHKDSRRNAEETGEFVVNIVPEALSERMNATSAEAPPEVDEFTLAGLETLPSRRVRPPRVKGAPAHFECRYLKTVELPCDDPESSNAIVLGTVLGVHIDDGIVSDGLIDMRKFRPVARLGYMDYTVVDGVFTMLRPD